MPNKTKGIGFRVSEEQFDQLWSRANARNMKLTHFMLAAALGELDVKPTDERFAEIEARLERLESSQWND